ncbi:hypothetical protein V7159_18195 [Priestia megaterium]|uniref:hypothetical protein n=1 Tax=Priestia megaterium TaxID=1404 RepID=UPI00300AAEA6
MSVALEEDIWIKEAEIVNFQSIKHIVIRLVNGTNAFVGESESGKSATIRAIRWCLINKPNGDYFITTGQKEAMVRVTLSNDKIIERRKGGGVNLYRLFYKDELLGEYTGFGTTVPPEIVEAHGIVPIGGDVYFQFSQQLESAFLLSLRPSKRAEVLGNLDELERIDSAISGINEDIRNHVKSQKEMKKENKTINKEITKLKGETERIRSKIETLKVLKEGLQTKINLHHHLAQQIERLKEIQVLMKEIDEKLFKANRVAEAWPSDLEKKVALAKTVIRHTNRLREIQDELNSFSNIKKEKLERLDELTLLIDKQVDKYTTVNKAVTALKANEKALEEIEKSPARHAAALDLQPLEKDIAKYKLLFNHINRIREIDKSLEKSDDIAKEAKGTLEKVLYKCAEVLKDAKLCPTCGQGTHDVCTDTVKNII